MTKRNWGGARNSKERCSDALTRAQCEGFLTALRSMVAKGMPPNRFLTVHWERLGIAPTDCMPAITGFIRRARDWARKQGFELAVIWVRENDEGDGFKGDHWHALYHIPEPILEAFTRKMTMRWLKQLVSGKYRVGAVKTRVIGRRSNDYRHALELYQRNLKILAVSYLLKGASREAAFALNLPRWHEGGNVTGKRWGRSQNLLQDSLLSGS